MSPRKAAGSACLRCPEARNPVDRTENPTFPTGRRGRLGLSGVFLFFCFLVFVVFGTGLLSKAPEMTDGCTYSAVAVQGSKYWILILFSYIHRLLIPGHRRAAAVQGSRQNGNVSRNVCRSIIFYSRTAEHGCLWPHRAARRRDRGCQAISPNISGLQGGARASCVYAVPS